MKVLLSIKPEFAEKIFDGTKKYEFRKNIFKRQNIDTVVVYASAPIQRIIGEFYIDDILYENVDSIWRKTKKYAGIEEQRYKEYFSDKEKAVAIKIKSSIRYRRFKMLSDFNINYAPQSYVYL